MEGASAVDEGSREAGHSLLVGCDGMMEELIRR